MEHVVGADVDAHSFLSFFLFAVLCLIIYAKRTSQPKIIIFTSKWTCFTPRFLHFILNANKKNKTHLNSVVELILQPNHIIWMGGSTYLSRRCFHFQCNFPWNHPKKKQQQLLLTWCEKKRYITKFKKHLTKKKIRVSIRSNTIRATNSKYMYICTCHIEKCVLYLCAETIYYSM